ncbi:GNAT family N-acetyltransferase [Dyella dinghuensis]|uniref:GNAT family N-acetyltransferase n=1 Tax=Dyella dinghuensis TaxID=1920169 RepID=A0A3S0PD14_9GAMM|nr:GNAT family N-acetyltransferase [Dyella dinghuensis]RUL62209.1 GNAT family N-acetyltransferase [Dyella dinghuensis]
MTIDIVVTAAPSSDVIAKISDELDLFNIAATDIADRIPLGVFAVDANTGTTLGGITGRTSLGMLFIDLFFLPNELRGSGLGTKLLAAAEDEARRRGCKAAVLYTISFQAPGFYTRNGWQVFGEIACDPPGTSRVFLSKDLTIPGVTVS